MLYKILIWIMPKSLFILNTIIIIYRFIYLDVISPNLTRALSKIWWIFRYCRSRI